MARARLRELGISVCGHHRCRRRARRRHRDLAARGEISTDIAFVPVGIRSTAMAR